MVSRLLMAPAQMLLVVAIALSGLVACQHRSTSQVADAAASTAPAITYNNRIAQIFASRCATCHYQGEGVQIVGGFAEKTYQGAQAPYFTDYASVKKYASIALSVMTSGVMPPAKNLGPTDVADLKTWISSGKPEGDPASAPQLSMSIKAILDRRCVACHHPGGSVDLTTYDAASGIHAAVIYTALNVLQNMPPSKNLTTDEFKALSDWSAAGGPQDAYDQAPPPPESTTPPTASSLIP